MVSQKAPHTPPARRDCSGCGGRVVSSENEAPWKLGGEEKFDGSFLPFVVLSMWESLSREDVTPGAKMGVM